MGLVHDLLYLLAAILAAPFWAINMLRTGKWRTDWAARFGRGPNLPPAVTKRLLIHAVSVGEVNAIRQLICKLENDQHPPEIVISSTTDTGHARARELFSQRHPVVRYPFDFSPAVRRFLDRVQPDAVALTELELWPNFTRACQRRRLPLLVINGRLSAHSFRGYRLLAPFVRPSFQRLTAAAVQTQTYAERFIRLGVPRDRVHVLDSMKWDTARITDHVPGADELAAALGIDRHRPLVVAGSTGPGEERLLIDAVRAHCTAETQLLLVPRRPERFDEVAALEPGIVRRTHPVQPADAPASLFLLDTMGELGKAYALADVAVVGRSFVDLGGSDPIEPIALGRPTLIGPHHANFTDIVAAFAEAGGITIASKPGPEIRRLLDSPAPARELAENGRTLIRQRQGATRRHAELLRRYV